MLIHHCPPACIETYIHTVYFLYSPTYKTGTTLSDALDMYIKSPKLVSYHVRLLMVAFTKKICRDYV